MGVGVEVLLCLEFGTAAMLAQWGGATLCGGVVKYTRTPRPRAGAIQWRLGGGCVKHRESTKGPSYALAYLTSIRAHPPKFGNLLPEWVAWRPGLANPPSSPPPPALWTQHGTPRVRHNPNSVRIATCPGEKALTPDTHTPSPSPGGVGSSWDIHWPVAHECS